MKINSKTKLAVKGNKNLTIKPDTKAEAKTEFSAALHNAKVIGKLGRAIALLTGKRGITCRAVQTCVTKTGKTFIRALQNNIGGTKFRNADGVEYPSIWAELDGGMITSSSPRQARVDLGGYVNGKNTGAKVKLVDEKTFRAKAGSCVVKWNNEDTGIRGSYVGNPNVKGMVALMVPYAGASFFWQMEQDANANNAHERGRISPVKAGDKLPVINL